MKFCHKCQRARPLEAFAKRTNNKTDGRQSRCKQCDAKRRAAHRAAHRTQDHKTKAAYRRTHHAEISTQQADYYAENRDRISNKHAIYRSTHRTTLFIQQRRAYEKTWRTENPEKVRAAKTRRRFRKSGAPVNDLSAAQFQEVCYAFGWRCAYCGKKAKKLTIDHVTPYKFNGSNTLWNVVPACALCNSKKSSGAVLTPVQPLLLTIAPARKRH